MKIFVEMRGARALFHVSENSVITVLRLSHSTAAASRVL